MIVDGTKAAASTRDDAAVSSPATLVDRRRLLAGALGGPAALALAACQPKSRTASGGQPPAASGSPSPAAAPARATAAPAAAASRPATNEQIAARATVPVLCWHQLRNWRSADSAYARNLLICPPGHFRAQLDALAADGWHTIGPDQYLAHLTQDAPLPDKPVLLSFDDAQGSQMTEALPQLLSRRMTATFFVMTVVLGNPGWLSRRDLRRLDAEGMTIAAHTWDHHRVDRYTAGDWAVQLTRPRTLLEQVIGKPVKHFAYPYGAWDPAAVAHVEAAGYQSAYQLADRTPDPAAPRYTLRRSLVSSTWTEAQLIKQCSRLSA